jgi:hypothetical protein
VRAPVPELQVLQAFFAKADDIEGGEVVSWKTF